MSHPQPVIPRRGSFFAMNGPATPHAPMWIAFITMKARTMTHSHVRLQNSCHPILRSWNIVVPPA